MGLGRTTTALLAMMFALSGCSSNATSPGTMQRLDALLLWQTPPDLGPAFYDKAYYCETCPKQETAEALEAVTRRPGSDAGKP